MQFPENVNQIITTLETAGFEAYAVGGCVRDMLAGAEPPDYDIATSAVPDEIKQVFSDCKTIDIGAKHGTIALITDTSKIEITTFRTDGDYSDSRRPDSVTFTRDLKSDLARRDFTVNAMAYSDKTGLIDLFGGESDLGRGILRCVGEPEKRFTEDALRIMRGLRFMAERGFSCEPKTGTALLKLKDRLNLIAPERIRAEFDRMLMGRYTESIILQYYDVLGVFVPEILACVNFNQRNNYHIYDVLTHTAKTIAAIPPLPENRLPRIAMFFHDIAKPECYRLVNNSGSFKGHAERSAEIARRVMRRLRYDNAAIDRVKLLVKHHDEEFSSDDVSVKKLLCKFGLETIEQLCTVKKADDSAKADFVKTQRQSQYILADKARAIIARGDCYSLAQLAINGADLLEAGYKGAQIGEKLRELLLLVIEGKLENDKTVLMQNAECRMQK
ncbi:MAG: HD domain-containing protein [Oscillospiraceae bacterium]|nr:HD domain-containing protein [Oscillospiraceae bacterium]